MSIFLFELLHQNDVASPFKHGDGTEVCNNINTRKSNFHLRLYLILCIMGKLYKLYSKRRIDFNLIQNIVNVISNRKL